MASYQAPNYIPEFSSYIPTINPADYEKTQQTYVQGGLQKQQQYDLNYQKIQGMVDTVGGLQVSKGIDKQYLDKKMGELSDNLAKIAGKDLSQVSILQNAAGYAAGVYNDRTIQNAVISTQNEQNALAQIALAHKEGKSSVTNDHALLRNIQKWREDATPGAQLGKQQYTNFFDYNKGFQDFMKDKHGTVRLVQQPGAVDENGNPKWDAYALREGKEVKLDALEVAADAQTYFASNAQARGQLDIDSLYYIDNTPVEQALEAFRYGKQREIAQIDLNIKQLEKEKALYPEKAITVDEQINAYRDLRTKKEKTFRDREQEFYRNPDAAKAKLYQENIIEGFANRYAYQDIESKIVKNPYFEGMMSVEDLALKKQKFEWEKESFKLEYDQKERLNRSLVNGITVGGQYDAAAAEKYTPQDYENDLKAMTAEVAYSQNKALYEAGGFDDLVTIGQDSQGNTVYRKKPGVTMEQFTAAWNEFSQSYFSNPQGASRAAKEYFGNQFSANSPYGKELAFHAEAKRYRNIVAEIEEKYNNDPDYLASKQYERELNTPNIDEVLGYTKSGALITRRTEINKQYKDNLKNLEKKINEDKKKALSNILLNDSQATVAKAKDEKNSDEFAALIAYASNQNIKAEEFTKVTGAKGAGQIVFGYTKNPVSQQVVAFAKNAVGDVATIELDPVTAQKLAPQLHSNPPYSGQERLLLANQGKYANVQSRTGAWYTPPTTNLQKYVVRYDIQKNSDGTGYAPIVQFKTKDSNTWREVPYAFNYFGSLEAANQFIVQEASQGDEYFYNTYLR